MSHKNTITIAVGKDPVAQSKRAVTLSKSVKAHRYDSIEWTTSDAGKFTIEFDGGNSPFIEGASFEVWQNHSRLVEKIKSNTLRGSNFKYSIFDSAGDPMDDPFVIIED